MRLLKCVQPLSATSPTIEFSLTEFYSSEDLPRYAILSHRWSTDEVILEDLETGTAAAREGFKKLQFCAQQAARDGISYFWIDTCCIDRKNYTELSKEINSMFRWLHNATKCYVYMSDVSALNTENQNDRHWESQFRSSSWFTRSWTLQELLAPKLVEFFSREGMFLGSKESLELQIHEITGIPISALRGAPLSTFSVEERFRWAAYRQSARGEDQAYSLMGIFDVIMPLLYGEGQHRAMMRLRREIIAAKAYADDDDNDTASIRSVASLSSNTTGSAETLVGEVLAAADEFVSLLLDDQTLTTLFSIAFDRIEADRVQRNMRRLLKSYASDLRQEAGSDIEKEAVRLIQARAGYIAYRIRQRYDKNMLDAGDELSQTNDIISGKRALLNRYLRIKATKDAYISQSEALAEQGNDNDMSDSDATSEETMDQLDLSDLDRVKAFMCESVAYRGFEQNLRLFVLPRREPEVQDVINIESASFISLNVWRRLQVKSVEILQGLRLFSRPLVPPGHKRITWICGCGDHRYADVRENRPNGASALEALLRRSAAVIIQHSENEGSIQPLQPPIQAHLSVNSAAQGTFNKLPLSSRFPGTSSASLNLTTDSSATSSSRAQADPRFLLLCLTINGSSMLEQLSVGDLGNDQYLWDMIRSRYHDLRAKTLWHQKVYFTRWLSNLRWLSWLVTLMDLTSANSIQFVRFQLVPIAMEIRPWNFHSPSVPPEKEVKVNKTYHYDPCPTEVDPTGLSREVLHCLWKPGPHMDRFWLNYLPKKLNETMCYAGSKPEINTGWGIRIVEGIDLASVVYLAVSLVSFSVVLGITYAAITRDVSSAFSVSAVMIVLPALGVALLQLRPND